MNSFAILCLTVYAFGVGVHRPEDRKKKPAPAPARTADAAESPATPAGPPIGFPVGRPPGIGPGVPFPMGFMPANGMRLLPARMAAFQVPMPNAPLPRPVQGGAFPSAPQRAELPKDLVPTLIESLKDKDADVRKYVAGALVRVGKEAVEPLIELLKGKDKAQRANAAYILGQIGADAQEAMPLLVKALKDEDKNVRLRAAFALERLLAAPRNTMRMGMGGMAFPPMMGMTGGQERRHTVALPADPGPVPTSADDDAKRVLKNPDKKDSREPEKKNPDK